MTTRRKGAYAHLELLDARDWGLIIYDEVHLLPAPIFRMTADLQARRRLGLTATLVREDGREGDVFSLIGPKRYDAPWKDIEAQGWIAPAECIEVRVTLDEGERIAYATAEPEERYRLASCTPAKTTVAEALVARHRGEPTLVIGQYLDQLDEIGADLDAPVIKGETTVKERQRLFQAFRAGEIALLVVSKVANFSIDLPEQIHPFLTCHGTANAGIGGVVHPGATLGGELRLQPQTCFRLGRIFATGPEECKSTRF